MGTAAFRSVIDAVQTTIAAALPGVRVVRGRDISGEPSDVVMVGVQNPDESDWESAGSFTQGIQTFGGAREEVGVVNGLISAWNGSADQGAALDVAFDYLAAIETAVRATPTLGLTAYDYVFAELSAGDVSESQNSAGAAAVLSFALDYKIRL